jgi:hypothetical protein
LETSRIGKLQQRNSNRKEYVSSRLKGANRNGFALPKSLRNPSPFGMRWEKRGMFRNVKALILNDRGIWRRGGNHTTTISSPVSRT